MKNLQTELSSNFLDLTKDEALGICAGEEILGIGKNRIVISDKDEVYKLAWREEGLRDNEIEYLLYKKASSSLRELLCPTILFAQEGFSKQVRCEPVLFRTLGQEGLDFVSKLNSFGLSDAAANIAFLNKKLVCYDYSLLSPDLLGKLLWESFYAYKQKQEGLKRKSEL